MQIRREQVPWAMAGARAALGPVMVIGARCGWNGLAMAGMVVVALLSDIFDGVLARRWRCDTAAVRLADSMADMVFYVGVGIAVWMSRPAVLREDAGLVGAVVALELVRYGVEFWKFGKPASYHSYLAKAWGLCMASAMVAVFASSRGAGWLGAAMVVGLISNTEGLAMSVVLPEWRKDVKGIAVAWRLRRTLRGSWERAAKQAAKRASGRRLARAAAMVGVVTLAGTLGAGRAQAQTDGAGAYVTAAVYEGGSLGLGTSTEGTLDEASAEKLVFRYREAGGKAGEIAIPYKAIQSYQTREETRHRLGALPAIAVGLIAARQKRYTLSITYKDEAQAAQAAIFEVSKRDLRAQAEVLTARVAPCMPVFGNVCVWNGAKAALPGNGVRNLPGTASGTAAAKQ